MRHDLPFMLPFEQLPPSLAPRDVPHLSRHFVSLHPQVQLARDWVPQSQGCRSKRLVNSVVLLQQHGG